MQCLALTLPVKMDTLKMDTLPSDMPVFKRLSSTSTYSFSVLLLHAVLEQQIILSNRQQD